MSQTLNLQAIPKQTLRKALISLVQESSVRCFILQFLLCLFAARILVRLVIRPIVEPLILSLTRVFCSPAG